MPSITIHTSTKFTQGQLLTTEPHIWVHTHINTWSKPHTSGKKWRSHCTLHSLRKPRRHKYRIQTKAHAHPHTPWNTRSQGKIPRLQLVTQLLTDHNLQRGAKYQYIYTQTHNFTQTQSLRCAIVCLCLFILLFFPLACCGLSVAVTNCHLRFFPWLLVFQGVWVCVCLGLYAILVFPRFL
jgi:hypothetical protein